MKIKLILIVGLIVIFCSVISYWLGTNQTGSFSSILESQVEHHSPPPVVIEPGSAVETASYIIFHDDEGFIYAKSGDTGEIVKSSDDASEVINWAINQLTNGGKIFIKEGVYDVKETIAWSGKTIYLIGEGSGNRGTLAGNAVTRLVPHAEIGSNPVIKIGTLGVDTWYGGISDLTIDAYNGGSHVAQVTGAIEGIDTSWMTFKNVLINYFCRTTENQFGFYFHGVPGGTVTHGNVLENCITYACHRHIYLGDYADGYTIINCALMGDFYDNSYGLYVDSNRSDTHKFFNLKLLNINNAGSIAAYLKSGAKHLEFYGLRIEDCAQHITIDYDGGYCYSNKFFGGTIDLTKVTDNGVRTLWHGATRGVFRSENSGTVTGTSPITVSHGLVDVPTTVVITPRTACSFAVTSRDATNFEITHDGGSVTFDWYAEYEP